MKKVLSIFLLVLSLQAIAQAPQKISYQAVARNTAGLIVANQAIAVKAEILDANQTTVLYAETHNVTTSQFGLFNLAVGGGTVVSGTFSTIDWGTGNKFIRTSVDLTGGTAYQLMGMSQLLSVPYALYAAKTNLVAGTGISITGGNTIAATSGSQWLSDTYGIYYQNSAGGIGVGGSTESLTAFTATQTSTFGTGAAASFKSNNGWQTAVSFNNSTVNWPYYLILAGSGNTDFPPKSFALYSGGATTGSRFVWNTDGTSNNFLAIGSYNNQSFAKTPKSRLHVFNGDINIEDIGKGIIMKSPNGNCWRITIDDSGNLIRTAIACP